MDKLFFHSLVVTKSVTMDGSHGCALSDNQGLRVDDGGVARIPAGFEIKEIAVSSGPFLEN